MKVWYSREDSMLIQLVMMVRVATHVNHVGLLLMVINLVAITSTSPPYFDNGEEFYRGVQSDYLSEYRAVRSIDDTKPVGSPEEKEAKEINKKLTDKQSANLDTRKASRTSVFSTENSTIIWAQIGGTASLPCVVKKNSGTVSWLRQWPPATPTLLSVGVNKYTADERYYVEHIRHLQNWGLVIKHVNIEDEGVYKCQVSTHPPTIILIHLKVTKAYAEIVGAPDLHLRAGSSLNLACQIRQSTEPPEYVFWYHEDRMINYDAGVRALTNSAANVLIVPDADKSHDGNYTCKPSNAVPAHINVHVLNATEEENPAAMVHSNTASTVTLELVYVFLLLSMFIDQKS